VTTFSGPGQFYVPRPVGLTPVGPIENTTPEFTWGGLGVELYTHFELYVNNLTTNTQGVIHIQDIPEASFTPDLPLENGRFEWFVRGFDASGNASQWSEGIEFTLTAAVGSATRITTVFGNPPTFVWTETPNAVEYEILVTTLSVANQPVVYNQLTSGSPFGFNQRFQTASSRLFAGEFRVWIRGIRANGEALPWSQPSQFTITALDEAQSDDPVATDSLIAMNSRSATGHFQSLVVHPAQTVATYIPTVVPTGVPAEAAEPETTDVVEPAVPQEAAESIDAIMEELATDGIFDGDLESVMESAEPVISEEAATTAAAEKSGDQPASAALLGLGLGAFTGRRRRRNRNRD